MFTPVIRIYGFVTEKFTLISVNIPCSKAQAVPPQNALTMTRSFYSDDYATIELDDAVPCVRLTLRGVPHSSEHYQLVQTKRLELMREVMPRFRKLHMLTDSLAAGPVLNEDVSYFKTEVLPTMEEAGIRCLAIVLPRSRFTMLTIQEMTENARKIVVRYFDNLAEARNWLQGQ